MLARPSVREEHPEWFRWRPDGTVQYAENPPKKYQDIYPFEFETAAWQSLWEELEERVRVLDRPRRDDLPRRQPAHQAVRVLGMVHSRAQDRSIPELIFLSEAFTRPRIMHKLAKLGFTQSYTYFTWRNTKEELVEYFTELTPHESREYFRPNVWPNTPDILHETLQHGGRPAFIVRVVLAATLAANYGIYGPAYELHGARAARAGQRGVPELREVRDQELGSASAPTAWRRLIARLNAIRNENPALQSDWSLKFHPVDNDQLHRLLASRRRTTRSSSVVNLDVRNPQSGWIDFGPWRTVARPAQRRALRVDAGRATTSSSARTRCRRTCSVSAKA